MGPTQEILSTPAGNSQALQDLRTRSLEDASASLGHDRLFQRLMVVQRAVANGSADPDTVALWNALREGVESLVLALSAAPVTVSRAEGQRRIRAWIERFADHHWPATTLH